MLFQGMFFIITPALICGAFAERMKFSTMVVFMILWGTLVYCPLCHWVWGGGILALRQPERGGCRPAGRLDFAGGTVVHISSGVSALVCALVLGQAAGLRQRADAAAQPDLHGHRRRACSGSAGSASTPAAPWPPSGLAASAFARHAFRRGGRRTDLGRRWNGSPAASRRVLGTCSGVVAGLVCITPAAGFVTPMPALLMGVAGGVVCYPGLHER